MNSNRKAVAGLVGLFIALNAAILWWRTTSSPPVPVPGGDDAVKRQEQQASTVAQWQSLQLADFDEPSIRKSLFAGRAEECCSVPKGATPLDLESLPDAERDDLTAAIIELLLIYAQNDPEKLVSYMAARNESPTAEILDFATEYLTNENPSQAVFPTKDDPAGLVVALWKEMRCNSHWSKLVADGTCLSLWEMPQDDVPELRAAAPRRTLFRNHATLTHQFAASQSAALETGGQPQRVADVAVLVRHDEALKDMVAPYYIRFWLDRGDGKWHPRELIYVDAGFQGSDKDLVILF